MNTTNIASIRPSGIHELNELFNNQRKPCGKGEIVRFNLAYQRIYPQLSRAEKRHAEILVDTLIDNLEDEKLASMIYGVV